MNAWQTMMVMTKAEHWKACSAPCPPSAAAMPTGTGYTSLQHATQWLAELSRHACTAMPNTLHLGVQLKTLQVGACDLHKEGPWAVVLGPSEPPRPSEPESDVTHAQ